jgi:hypothetical protein
MTLGRHPRALALLALGLVTLSCATSKQLTLRSEKLLIQGDARRAYDVALDALAKDPRNESARQALGAAGSVLLADARTRFYNVIPVDTVAAAGLAMEVDELNATLLRCRAAAPADTAFAADRTRARWAAADGIMRAAEDSLDGNRPRPAYRMLQQAARFAPHRGDLDARLRSTFEQAVDRVAVLPLDDQVGQPALARGLASRCATALQHRIDEGRLEFTRLVEPARVNERMTLAQLDDLSRSEAIRVGREVGATVVLWGRLHNAGTDNFVTYYREPLWHRVVERAQDGGSSERWVQVPFEAVVRERVYHLRCDLRLLDTDDEGILAETSLPREARVRTVWTNFRPDDDPDNYSLVAPEAPRPDGAGRGQGGSPDHDKRSGQAQKEWSTALGKWTLPEFLGRARGPNLSARSSYRHEYRGEFERASLDHPVFLGAPPGTDDLAYLALRGVEDGFLGLIEDLDTR